MRYILRVGCAMVALALAGCNKANKSSLVTPQSMMMMSQPEPGSRANVPRRYIAMRHRLTVEAAEDNLESVWESTRALCGKLDCEMTESSLQKKTDDSSSSGSITLRVAHRDLDKLFAHVGKAGVIVQHSSESEDKTAAVIDTEAELHNQTGYRDSLRTMLAKPSATFKDLLEVQRELVRVQSELDALAGKRKVLEAETEKVAVQIGFRAKQLFASRSLLAPISNALRMSGATLAESIAALITVAFALIPWLIPLVLIVWMTRKFGLKFWRWKTRTNA